jgi:hypothetical protein
VYRVERDTSQLTFSVDGNGATAELMTNPTTDYSGGTTEVILGQGYNNTWRHFAGTMYEVWLVDTPAAGACATLAADLKTMYAIP